MRMEPDDKLQYAEQLEKLVKVRFCIQNKEKTVIQMLLKYDLSSKNLKKEKTIC